MPKKDSSGFYELGETHKDKFVVPESSSNKKEFPMVHGLNDNVITGSKEPGREFTLMVKVRIKSAEMREGKVGRVDLELKAAKEVSGSKRIG